MDTINQLQALRQEFCDISNKGTDTRAQEGAIHLVISRIDLLVEALTEYNTSPQWNV